MELRAACLAIISLVAVAAPARAGEVTLPNLVPMPPQGVIVDDADQSEDFETPQPAQALRFGTTTYNVGDYPLDLMFAPASLEDIQANGRDILQCTAFVGPVCTERSSAGRAFYHGVHGHWHMEAYADYELVPVTEEGLPDFEAAPVAPGTKASFCVMDTSASDDASPTDVATYGTCDSVRQGMSAKHGDTYDRGLYGQQIVIDDVPPGIYGLVITVDPSGRLFETSRSDNRAWVVIDLSADRCQTGEVPVLRSGVS
jgi:hypothetical protein